MVAIQVANIELLAGGAVDKNSGGGFAFEARDPDHTNRTLDTTWGNTTALTVTGSYDPATRRFQGTFEVTFECPSSSASPFGYVHR